MPLSIWKKLSLPKLTPTRMTLELADRSVTRPKGVAEDVFVKVGKFHFPTDFVVVDFKADPRVSLILRRSFLRTDRALIDIYGEEITLRVNDEAVTFNLNQTTRYSSAYDDMSVNRIDVIDVTCEEYAQEVLGFSNNSMGGNPTPTFEPIISDSSPSFTPFEGSDFILEEIEAYLKDDSISLEIDHADFDPERDICLIEKLLNNDPFQLPPMDLKQVEVTKAKSSIEEPPELELKDLPSHLEYAYLEGTDKLPVIIANNLKDDEKEALLKVLKSHKQAIAWKITDIKGGITVDANEEKCVLWSVRRHALVISITFASSTQQDIYAAGSKTRPPMLNKENYVPWSYLLRYAKCVDQMEVNQCTPIMNGVLYVRRMIPEPGDADRDSTVPETLPLIQTEKWVRVKQMMKGSDIGIQEKKAKLFNEWERFTSTDGESIESYYHRFSKLMNDFKRNKHFPEKIASNLKFLNNLQPEWSRHVTIIAQPGMNMGQDRQMRMVGANGGNQFRQYAGQNVGYQNEYNAVQNVGNQVVQDAVQNQGVQNIGNRDWVILARNCTVRTKGEGGEFAAYLQTQLLIAQKEEVGIQLQAEEFVFDGVERCL
ncbi:reverse transcriptase domain-containing protein [Tanacetum coccineum]|uniref:Reverse transcriptase domain-containing protein n=1 Tax=Tanacetum coccineum TaxID=301880 RepID=A0ABQ4YVD3_9ASTR